MFEMFVVGPVATSGLGLIGRCIECQALREKNAPPCAGFGAGCLAFDPHQIAKERRP